MEKLEQCFAVVRRIEGRKFVACAPRMPDELPDDVGTKFILSTSIREDIALSHAILADFLPKALAAGSYLAAPEPQVVGNGLDQVQVGLDSIGKKVSAKKIVVTI